MENSLSAHTYDAMIKVKQISVSTKVQIGFLNSIYSKRVTTNPCGMKLSSGTSKGQLAFQL